MSRGSTSIILPSVSLLWREVKRFLRQRSRVIGAFGSPLIFWVVLGSGFGRSFQSGLGTTDRGYLEYFFPGVLVMILLFTAIFATISVIEDRQEGFLQGVLVAPVARASIVLGKVLGATVLALLQAMVFLLLAPFAGLHIGFENVLELIGVFILVGFTLSAMGFWLAWRMESVQGFHAIMNMLLLPMWLLCGAVFPASGAPKWVGWVMAVNPLTYGMSAVRRALYQGSALATTEIPSFKVSLGVTVLFGAVLFAICFVEVAKGEKPRK